MAESLSSLHIVVKPSPETNDHEVCLLDGEDNIIQRFDDSMIGLDPDDLLTSSCPLLPRSLPHRATIARCDCGVIGCGSVDVVIERTGEVITWRDPDSSTTVRFSVPQYEAEVRRALLDFSWESPDRTAARLISSSIDHESLEQRGFKYIWSSGRITSGHITVALMLADGPYQVLVHVEAGSLSPDQVAQRCLQVLTAEPSAWSNVTWYPQAQGLGDPAVAGAGWRKGSA